MATGGQPRIKRSPKLVLAPTPAIAVNSILQDPLPRHIPSFRERLQRSKNGSRYLNAVLQTPGSERLTALHRNPHTLVREHGNQECLRPFVVHICTAPRSRVYHDKHVTSSSTMSASIAPVLPPCAGPNGSVEHGRPAYASVVG